MSDQIFGINEQLVTALSGACPRLRDANLGTLLSNADQEVSSSDVPLDRIAWVNKNIGNDETAQVGQSTLPFKTIAAAVEAIDLLSIGGSGYKGKVVLSPDTYEESLLVKGYTIYDCYNSIIKGDGINSIINVVTALPFVTKVMINGGEFTNLSNPSSYVIGLKGFGSNVQFFNSKLFCGNSIEFCCPSGNFADQINNFFFNCEIAFGILGIGGNNTNLRFIKSIVTINGGTANKLYFESSYVTIGNANIKGFDAQHSTINLIPSGAINLGILDHNFKDSSFSGIGTINIVEYSGLEVIFDSCSYNCSINPPSVEHNIFIDCGLRKVSFFNTNKTNSIAIIKLGSGTGLVRFFGGNNPKLYDSDNVKTVEMTRDAMFVENQLSLNQIKPIVVEEHSEYEETERFVSTTNPITIDNMLLGSINSGEVTKYEGHFPKNLWQLRGIFLLVNSESAQTNVQFTITGYSGTPYGGGGQSNVRGGGLAFNRDLLQGLNLVNIAEYFEYIGVIIDSICLKDFFTIEITSDLVAGVGDNLGSRELIIKYN